MEGIIFDGDIEENGIFDAGIGENRAQIVGITWRGG